MSADFDSAYVEEFETKSVTGIIDDMAARLATLEEAEFELMLLAR